MERKSVIRYMNALSSSATTIRYSSQEEFTNYSSMAMEQIPCQITKLHSTKYRLPTKSTVTFLSLPSMWDLTVLGVLGTSSESELVNQLFYGLMDLLTFSLILGDACVAFLRFLTQFDEHTFIPEQYRMQRLSSSLSF